MKIETDTEGQQIIQRLCDVALKAGGLANLIAINKILNSITLIEQDKVDKQENIETKSGI